jgi:pimeloyl-ACP methyl ester carboxylesterase
MRNLFWLAALVITALFAPLLAQAQPTPPTDPSTPPMSDPLTTAAERFRPDRIAWQPCPENAAVECGTLTVPVDYAQPQGETFEMAVIRAKATDPARRIGTLFLNPGGPGGSGVDFVLAGVGAPPFEAARVGFDMVSFDVRGSNRSQRVSCDVVPLGELPAGEAEQIASLDSFSRRFAETCLAQAGPLIRTMSFNTIALDMDVLRRALGERQISYVGISFGTTLGAVYASRFPTRVRAMILDSGVKPNFRDSSVEFHSEQFSSFEQTLHRLDHVCRKDAACLLRDDGVVATLDALLARLRVTPVRAPDGAVLDAANLQGIVTSLLQFDANWPLLVRALANARGGDYGLLFQLIPSISSVPLTNTAFHAIRCNSFGTRRLAADTLPTSQAVGGITSRLFSPTSVAQAVAICAAWTPADPPIIRDVAGRLDHPILFFGTDFDPNTPFSWTRSLAFALGDERNIVRYQGGGHTIVTRGTACVGGIVVNYLFNLVVPPEGTTCPARPLTFAPTAQAGAQQALDGFAHGLWQDTEAQPAP